MPKCMPIDTNQHNPTKSHCLPCMPTLTKRKWNSQCCATLWQGKLHKVAAPYFFIIMYIVRLYKEDWTILHMLGCQTVALPNTEQIDIPS